MLALLLPRLADTNNPITMLDSIYAVSSILVSAIQFAGAVTMTTHHYRPIVTT
jgi:hypothetical protein